MANLNPFFIVLVSTIILSCAKKEADQTPAPTPTPAPVLKNTLIRQWETDAIFKVPESVIYDSVKKTLYVSNVNGDPSVKDGNGFISKLNVSGKVEILEWIKGLDAPKGMGIYNDRLYVADISNVKVIDIASGAIVEEIELPGAVFLNDLAIDKNGIVFISDTDANIIFKIDQTGGYAWLANAGLNGPNGLFITESELYLVEYGSGGFYSIDMDTKKLESIASGFTEGDGIVQLDTQEWLISSFNGEVSHLKDGIKKVLVDTKSTSTNAADMGYVGTENLVLVPTFFKNTVAGYKFQK